MMKNNLRMIDLSMGIGARVYGFQNAGFDVICAADASQISREICEKLLDIKQFICDDIKNISSEQLPEAEIITADLAGPVISAAGKRESAAQRNTAVAEIIDKKVPYVFLLEVHAGMLMGKRLPETIEGLGMRILRRYSIIYHVLKDEDFSGVPIAARKGYIIGIRMDIFREEMCFPSGTDHIRKISLEDPAGVDAWYRHINRLPESGLEKGRFYVKRIGRFLQTDKVNMSFLREMYLVDDIGFRRFTHNECAALKGITGYNFNLCVNKTDMYRRIANSSNVFVINAIAEVLREYLENGSIRPVNKQLVNDGSKKQKKTKKEKQVSASDYIYPRQSLIKLSVKNLKGLNNMDVSFEKNLTAIMGVNGSGKSTILHALACVYSPYKYGEDYKFSYFFTPNPDSSWKNSEFSITIRNEIDYKQITRVYRKNKDRWSPRYNQRPKRDVYFIGIESCVPEIEKESQVSFIDYQTRAAQDKNADKIIAAAAYILNKDYDQLNYHKTRKKDLLGVHTLNNIKYSSLSMGAGEQRVLRILQTVYTAASYSMILIDEIDLLLHVTALKRMIEHLDQVAKRRNLQIIFTTHSMEMSRMQNYIDIRYLEPLPQKTIVYNRITPDIVYELNDEVRQDIKIYVEDTLAEMVVNVVAESLGMSRYVTILKMGAARNAFLLASSFVLQRLDTENIMILLDGDVYREDEDKKTAVKKELTGTETDHEDKIEAAVEKMAPEKYIFNMLIEMDNNSELSKMARKLKAVSDSHQWLDLIVDRLGESEEIILYKMVSLVSEHEKWADYVKDVRKWLQEKRSAIEMESR